MLQKRRDLGSIPDGLGVLAEDTIKGTAVVRKIVNGIVTYAKPATEAEAKNIYGFVTLRIDEKNHPDANYDKMKAGKKAVAYTWVKNNEWATTEFTGDLVVGQKAGIGFTGEDKGKVIAATDANATLEVVNVTGAMNTYSAPLVTVKILV